MNTKFLFLVIGSWLLLVTCNLKKEKEENYTLPKKLETIENNSTLIPVTIRDNKTNTVNVQKDKKESLIYREGIFQEGDYKVKYVMFENGDGIIAEHYYESGNTVLHRYEDISLLLTIKKNELEFINKQIHKDEFKEFVPEEIRNIMTFVSFYYDSSTSVSISFILNLCQPDTDFCFSFEITFLETGEMITKLLPEESFGD